MQTKFSQKEGLKIRIVVARSNPVIWRELYIPANTTVLEFKDAACIALGIRPLDGMLLLEEKIAENTEPVSVFFMTTDWAVLKVFPENNKKKDAGLELYMDKLPGEAAGGDIPEVTAGDGINVPAGIGDIYTLNYIHQGVDGVSALVCEDVVYERHTLVFSASS